MMSRSWYCGLLIIAVVIFGCGKETPKAPAEQEQAQKEPEMVPVQPEQAQSERTSVNTGRKLVKLETSMGDIVIELNEKAAPVTVNNFLEYVKQGFYDGTIFHRVIDGFMIQGGGYTIDMERKQTRAPIKNEASNGLKNDRGTIAMARQPDPDSATSQFFINLKNNAPLNYVPNLEAGYTVFGKVIEGMDFVDAIAKVKTTTRKNQSGAEMLDVPVEPVVIKSAMVLSQ
jgi:cyclophilin family peptidyl-prolyl cis-trans isomerase